MLPSLLDSRQGSDGAALAEAQAGLDVFGIAQEQADVRVLGRRLVLAHVVRRVFVAIDGQLQRDFIELLERSSNYPRAFAVQNRSVLAVAPLPVIENSRHRRSDASRDLDMGLVGGSES